MLINLFFSFSILVSQLYTTDKFEFTVFNKTVLIQDTEEPKDNQRIDEDGMIERTYYSKELMTGYEMSFSEAFRSARKLKGPGQIFVWNGKHYTTDYYYELVISVGDQVIEVNYDEPYLIPIIYTSTPPVIEIRFATVSILLISLFFSPISLPSSNA